MIKNLLSTFVLILIVFCSGETDKQIYETQGGEFASQPGNFIADFPTKPQYSSIDNQIGLDKFKIHLFRNNLGPNKIFSIEYYDYPEHMINGLTNAQLYAQGVTNYANKMSESFKLEFQESIEQHGLDGQYFVLNLKQNAINKGINGHIQGKLFRVGTRVYTVTYMGAYDRNIGSFMDSFRLLN